MLNTLGQRPELKTLLNAILELWPKHEKFLAKSFKDRSEQEMNDSELLASLINRIIAKNMETYCHDYRWTCDEVNKEAIYFFSNGTYRYSKFSEVADFVYHNTSYMEKYLHGLLMSQLLWANQFKAFAFLKNTFLGDIKTPFRHLEIGPGHGLLLHLASDSKYCSIAEGWDISDSSLRETKMCLDSFGANSKVTLRKQDIGKVEKSLGFFDTIVLSEVLEHVEDPVYILSSASMHLGKSGKIFINVPLNSPALDHIYLLQDLEDVFEIVKHAGLKVVAHRLYPMTGYTLELAKKRKATISCVVVAEKTGEALGLLESENNYS